MRSFSPNFNLGQSGFHVLIPCVQARVRILIYDDDATAAELMRRALRRYNPTFQLDHVFTEQEYLAALQSYSPDIILSDYKLPLHGGAFALKMARELCPNVPFIFVSEVLPDGVAMELLKHGARAYISKANLQQLGPAVDQALAEAGQRHDQSAETPASSRINRVATQS